MGKFCRAALAMLVFKQCYNKFIMLFVCAYVLLSAGLPAVDGALSEVRAVVRIRVHFCLPRGAPASKRYWSFYVNST